MLLFCEIVVSIFSLFSHALFVCPGSFPLLFHSFPCHCLRNTDHFPSSSISHLFPLRRFHARKDPHSLCHPSLLLRARGFSFTWFCPHVHCVSDLKCEFFAFSPNEQDHLGTNSLASETIFIIIQQEHPIFNRDIQIEHIFKDDLRMYRCSFAFSYKQPQYFYRNHYIFYSWSYNLDMHMEQQDQCWYMERRDCLFHSL